MAVARAATEAEGGRGALLVSLGGCGERRIPDSDTEATTGPTTSTGESEDTASPSTGDEAIDDRFFGAFYLDYALGWKNDDPTRFIAWSQMEVRREGTIVYHRMNCDIELETIEVSWFYEPTDKAIHIVPNSGDRVDLGVCLFSAVKLTLGDDCDELLLEFKDCNDSDGTSRFLPGLLCAEPSGEECITEIVWCDEEPMPACQLP